MKILIADDDIAYRFPISCMLGDFGYEVVEARDVEELRRHANGAPIWIVDARLPSKALALQC